MNDFQYIPVEGSLFYTFEFADQLPAGVDISNVSFSITPSITLDAQSNDFGNDQSSIKVSGAEHGVRYNLQAKALLTNDEYIVKDVCLIGFNG